MATTIFDEADENPELLEWLKDGSKGHSRVGEHFGFSEASVRRWRKANGVELNTQPPAPKQDEPEATKGTITVDKNGAEINNVVVTSPVNEDWTSVFALFNMSADEFEVVDDTVRMSTWQQSKGTDDGQRDTIQLWSYSARFRRKSAHSISAETVERWRADLIRDRFAPVLPNATLEGGYSIQVADPQIGKKGTEEAVENWRRGIKEHLNVAALLNISQLHIAFMGDETENVSGSYANQPATIELNRTQQLELDFEMRVWTIREALALGVPVTGSSVISNHGEWTRWGMSKNVTTSQNDNASTYIARQVKNLFDELAPFTGQHVEWTIGNHAPGVVVDIAGVPAYFSHGYIEKGKGGTTEARTHNAIERQILGDTPRLGEVPLWFMAHYHHFYSNEFQDRTLFGCPALEAERSSEYMEHQYGVWSKPGMLGVRIDPNSPRKWTDLNVF